MRPKKPQARLSSTLTFIPNSLTYSYLLTSAMTSLHGLPPYLDLVIYHQVSPVGPGLTAVQLSVPGPIPCFLDGLLTILELFPGPLLPR